MWVHTAPAVCHKRSSDGEVAAAKRARFEGNPLQPLHQVPHTAGIKPLPPPLPLAVPQEADAEMGVDVLLAVAWPPPGVVQSCPPCFAHRFCRPGVCSNVTQYTAVGTDAMQL